MATEVIVTSIRERRSIRLEKLEIKALKKFREKFNTAVECAQEIGIDRNVLDRVLLAGSGSPSSISKIRAAISE